MSLHRKCGRSALSAARHPPTEPGDLRQDHRPADQTSVGRCRLRRNTLRLQPRSRNVPGVLRPGRESDLSAELVASYRLSLVGEGKSSSTVGVHLAAIKTLTRAAVMAGFIPAEVAASINDVKGAPRRGNRIGNWLTREQAQELLSLPDRESLKGIRDYAILALLLGCGLRRTELVSEVKVGAILSARTAGCWSTSREKGTGFVRLRSPPGSKQQSTRGPSRQARTGTPVQDCAV